MAMTPISEKVKMQRLHTTKPCDWCRKPFSPKSAKTLDWFLFTKKKNCGTKCARDHMRFVAPARTRLNKMTREEAAHLIAQELDMDIDKAFALIRAENELTRTNIHTNYIHTHVK